MNYQDFDVENFAMDDYFQKWVKYPDAESNLFWESWLNRHPGKKEVIEQARKIILAADMEVEELPEFEVQHLWEKIKNDVKSDNLQFKSRVSYVQTVSNYRPWMAFAAVMVGILLISSFWYIISNQKIEISTQYGETLTVILPDQSSVTLNANTTLSYNKNWLETTSREVWLDGEAYFKVLKKEHTANSKFFVHTNELNVEVFGTEFNVNNRQGHAKVVLNSGKIKINASEAINIKELMMEPGELVEFNLQNKILKKTEVNPEVFSSWKNNKLIFDNTSLKEIAVIIKENYGLNVQINDKKLAKRKLTGEINVESVEDLILAISEGLQVKVTMNKNLIIIEQ